MISEAALGIALIVFPPPLHTDPFTPDASYSLEYSNNWYPIHEPWLETPTQYLYTTTGVGADTYPLDDESLPPEQILISPSNPEWDTLYRMNVGIQVEDLDILRQPNQPWNYQSIIHEVIKNLRDTFQTLNASYRRDLGVDLKISHIRFYHEAGPNNQGTKAFWKDSIYPLLPSNEIPNGILRISENFQGGIASFSTCSIEEVAVAEYRWEFWAAQSSHNLRYSGHELGHTLFRLAHTQCLDLDPGPAFVPIEKCGVSVYGCWIGAVECPDCNEMSLMGYCGECCPQNTPVRMGPYHGIFASYGRTHIISLSTCKSNSIYSLGIPSTIDPTIDTDGDEIPDYLDNCKASANNLQRDFDMDGHGDACDGCQICDNRTASPWWLLLFPILYLLKRYTK